MKNKEILIKQIKYRSKHRGSKEMDILLEKFVNKCINSLNENELNDLLLLINKEDEILYDYYYNEINKVKLKNNKVNKLFKNFKL